MTAVTPLPGMPRRCARIVANARLEAAAEARRKACQRAKAMMDDPRGYTDAQMQTACGWFMNQSKSDRDDDGNVYYQRADELLYSITLRQRAAINRKTFVSGYDPDRERPEDHGLALIVAVLAVAGLAAVAFGWVLQNGWPG